LEQTVIRLPHAKQCTVSKSAINSQQPASKQTANKTAAVAATLKAAVALGTIFSLMCTGL